MRVRRGYVGMLDKEMIRPAVALAANLYMETQVGSSRLEPKLLKPCLATRLLCWMVQLYTGLYQVICYGRKDLAHMVCCSY